MLDISKACLGSGNIFLYKNVNGSIHLRYIISRESGLKSTLFWSDPKADISIYYTINTFS